MPQLEWGRLGTKIIDIFFGTSDGLLYALVALVILDYITGVCVAIHKKKVSSELGARGIAKKVAIFSLISVSHIVDRFLLDSVDIVRTITTTFYLSNECISIMENALRLGLPLPDKLKQILTSIGKEKKAK